MTWLTSVAMMAAMQAGTAPPPAATTAAPCATPAAKLPRDLAGWSRMVPVAAGTSPTTAARLEPGQGARAALQPAAALAFAVKPGKPGDAASSGGLFAFAVPRAGRYRVALGSGAWIDVVRDDRAVPSVAHGHGPDCSGIAKTVDFDLSPGTYLLQIAGSAAPSLPLLVARLR